MIARQIIARFACCVAFALSPSPAPANIDSGLVARLSYLDLEAGLSGDLVFAMVQDRHGFVWIGTDNGLDRYDGSRIRSFRRDPGRPDMLHGQTVTSLLIDRHGRLWVGTWGAGLYRYLPETETFHSYRHQPAVHDSLQSDYIDHLAETADGRVAVGTQTGVDLLDVSAGRFERLVVTEPADAHGDLRVRHLLTDARGNLWIATRRGLFVKAHDAPDIRQYLGRDPDAQRVLAENIYTLVEDGDNALLLGTTDGVWRLSDEGVLSVYVPVGVDPARLRNSRVSAMLRTRDGGLVIGTLEHGALWERCAAGMTRLFSQAPSPPYGIRDNQIASLLETDDGSLWFGTLTRGISRAGALSLSLEHYTAVAESKDSLPDSHLAPSSFFSHENIVWLGTESGLVMFEPAERRFTSVSKNTGWTVPTDLKSVNAVVPGRAGHWLIGKAGHNVIYRVNPRAREIVGIPLRDHENEPLHDFLYRALEDRDGNLWLTWYESKAGRLDPATGRVNVFDLRDPHTGEPLLAPHLKLHPQYGVVIVTDRGLLLVDTAGTNLRWFLKWKAGDQLKSVVFDADGGYWIGAESGAYRFSATGEQLERITGQNGLPEDKVLGVEADKDGGVWFITRRGVVVRDPVTGDLHALRGRDGLQSDYIFGFDFLADGRVVVVGPNGLNVFSYAAVLKTLQPAPLRITSIEVFTSDGEGTTLPSDTDKVVLAPEQDHLRLHFSLLDFADPSRNRYEYRVLGSNEQWTPIDNTARMMLQRIEPGDFTLEIRAYGPSGVAAANIIALAIESQPHWYESMPAKIGYALAALCPFVLLGWLAVRNARTRTYLDAEIHRRRLLETMYELTTVLAESASEKEIARAILDRLQELTPFQCGALYFRKGETVTFIGSTAANAAYRQWFEELPAAKPRLLARVSFNDGPLPLLARDVGLEADGAVHWLGVPGFSRDGAAGVLLLGRDVPWNGEDIQLVGAVFRQVVRGLDLAALRRHEQIDAHRDGDSGLLARDAFLSSAVYVGRLAAESRDHVRLLTLNLRLPEATSAEDRAALRVTLARVGQRVLAQIGMRDVAGRLDERRIALLLPDTSADGAAQLAARLAASIEGIGWADDRTRVGVSIDVHELDGQRGLIDQLSATPW